VERTYVTDDDFELPPLEELAAGTEWRWGGQVAPVVEGETGRDAPFEVRLPLGRGARTVPRQLQQLVWAPSLGSAMRTVAEIRADRTVRRWVDAAAAATSWREIAVDLADGDEGLLSAVDGVFRQREQHFRAAWKAAGRKPLHRWLR